MILQALVNLYKDLLENGKITQPGWNNVRTGFALCIDTEGRIHDIIQLTTETVDAKGKTKITEQIRTVPAPFKRSSGIRPNFLCDNAKYLLGLDSNKEKSSEKQHKAEEYFLESKAFHKELLSSVQSDAATAIVRFFDRWNPAECGKNPIVSQWKESLCKGSNLIFRINGTDAQEDPAVKEAWQSFYFSGQDGDNKIRCLITGETDQLAKIHPAIKGVVGAQSSGAALVSFNADAFCSYNREQGENAPIGKKAAFAYTTALNYLLADRENVQQIGDTTVVCWAEGAEPQYQLFSNAFLFGQTLPEEIRTEDLYATMKKLASLQPCEDFGLSPDRTFYILGLAPNAARLSVRFFLHSSFGTLMKNVNDHYERLQIVGSKYKFIPLWALLRETVNLNAKEKTANPILGGAVARAIFSGQRYPASLLEAVMLRIRAEQNVTSGRAAILKAYYLQNEDPRCPKEVLTVSLNENSTNIPYTIGRLFAWYEAAQEAANPGINTTIRDKYFNSAAATPARILPVLNQLYQHHLKKMNVSGQIFFEKNIGALIEILGEDIPARLSLPEQGAFQIGYYHQKQKRFEKKEK